MQNRPFILRPTLRGMSARSLLSWRTQGRLPLGPGDAPGADSMPMGLDAEALPGGPSGSATAGDGPAQRQRRGR